MNIIDLYICLPFFFPQGFLSAGIIWLVLEKGEDKNKYISFSSFFLFL